jgi:hypothetical protein
MDVVAFPDGEGIENRCAAMSGPAIHGLGAREAARTSLGVQPNRLR